MFGQVPRTEYLMHRINLDSVLREKTLMGEKQAGEQGEGAD